MAKQVIQSDSAPAAIGPYSQGVRAGDTYYFSGQIPLDPERGELVDGGIDAQTEQVMKNMRAVPEAAGLGMEDFVKTTIYLTNLEDFAVVNEIYGRSFATLPPARATVGVAALPKGAAIEIEWIASRA